MESFTYQIKRTPRASKTRIVVTLEKIEVIAPFHISDDRLHQFVKEQWSWITDAVRKLKSRAAQHQSLAPKAYHDGASIPYQGKTYPLSLAPTDLKKIKIEHALTFTAHIPHAQWDTIGSEEIRAAIIRWMKINVKMTVEQLVCRHGPKHQLFPKSIVIKSQKSRWGSCGIHNDIAINWLLALAPLEILEYVVVHELCHIQEKNHSKQFWALVAQHLPTYRSARLWLKQHGRTLMLGI
nr:SprT family zinc-dependent metalloprotease [Methylomicrobium lacus]